MGRPSAEVKSLFRRSQRRIRPKRSTLVELPQPSCYIFAVPTQLPIHAVVREYQQALKGGSVVVTAPTGSGKSTELPRVSPRPVVIVEPRRVACRSLATRVAELEGTALGDKVGYVVRDDSATSTHTEILFVTPGIALANLDEYLRSAATFIIDEVHERSLDIDLLIALSRDRARRLVVMSATIDAEHVAISLSAELVEASGRTHPVSIEYDDSGPSVPTSDRLAERIKKALQRTASNSGDTLVFLPGKGEIATTRSAIQGMNTRSILSLHGGLTPQEQASIFAPNSQQKIILSTNVAETSLTVPGVRTVIDSGLVRQVRYLQDRATLTLLPAARDAADQRAGRAGRTAPGKCIRLWRRNAHLESHTPPEIFRMSLVPLVLACRAHNRDPDVLKWLDTPKDHAINSATEELIALGALDAHKKITERGHALFRLPVDPWSGRILVEAEKTGQLDDAIDLVAALEIGRPMYAASSGPVDEDDPRSAGCDILALVRALREEHQHVHTPARNEALTNRQRLRRALGRKSAAPVGLPDKDALTRLILSADPRAARVRRDRGRKTTWGGVGTEVELDKRSAVVLRCKNGVDPLPDALLVLGLRSVREGAKNHLIATAATPVTLAALDARGFGTPSISRIQLKNRRILTEVQRVFAGKVLGIDEEEASGAILREGFTQLVVDNRIMKGVFSTIDRQLSQARLIRRLAATDLIKTYPGDLDHLVSDDDAKQYLLKRVTELGLEEQEDCQLIEPEDLLPAPLPDHLAAALERDYPQQVDLGEAKYTVEYDLRSRRAILVLQSGTRHKAPPRRYLPRFPGMKVSIQAGRTLVDLDR
ncbi:MAG: helicase-related protein [Myxococcota bacterium]